MLLPTSATLLPPSAVAAQARSHTPCVQVAVLFLDADVTVLCDPFPWLSGVAADVQIALDAQAIAATRPCCGGDAPLLRMWIGAMHARACVSGLHGVSPRNASGVHGE